jgi:hypothetical protein
MEGGELMGAPAEVTEEGEKREGWAWLPPAELADREGEIDP